MRGQRGSALIAALALISVAFAVTTIVTLRATLDAQRLARASRRLEALNVAEAGLAQTLQEMRMDPWLGGESGAVGRAEWRVVVTHDASLLDYQIATLAVEAQAVDQRRRIVMRVQVWPSPALDAPARIRLIDWTLLP